MPNSRFALHGLAPSLIHGLCAFFASNKSFSAPKKGLVFAVNGASAPPPPALRPPPPPLSPGGRWGLY